MNEGDLKIKKTFHFSVGIKEEERTMDRKGNQFYLETQGDDHKSRNKYPSQEDSGFIELEQVN